MKSELSNLIDYFCKQMACFNRFSKKVCKKKLEINLIQN